MRVLVTGGAGYLGSAIVLALERAGHEAIAFSRQASAARPPGGAIDGDIRDTRAVTAAAAGVDAICHAAALVALWRRVPSEFDAVTVGGPQSVPPATPGPGRPRAGSTPPLLPLPPA